MRYLCTHLPVTFPKIQCLYWIYSRLKNCKALIKHNRLYIALCDFKNLKDPGRNQNHCLSIALVAHSYCTTWKWGKTAFCFITRITQDKRKSSVSLPFIPSHSLIFVFHSTGLKKRLYGRPKVPSVEGGTQSWSQTMAVPHTERTGHDGSRKTVHPARRLARERGWEHVQRYSGEWRQQLDDRERKNSLLNCCPDVVHVMGQFSYISRHLHGLLFPQLFTVAFCTTTFSRWYM